MARTRYLKPDFFDSESVTSVSFAARLLFAGLWTLADRKGLLLLSPRRIKARIFPYDDVRIEDLFDEILNADLVVAYEAEGRLYLWIPGFIEHQRPHPNEAKSTLPAVPTPVVAPILPWRSCNITSRNDAIPALADVPDSCNVTSLNGSTPQPSVSTCTELSTEQSTARPRVASIIRRRDLTAFWESPIYNIPQKWADASIRKSNGRLQETHLLEFASWLHQKVTRESTDVQRISNFLGWLDDELRTWRGKQADEREDHRGDAFLAEVAKLARGEYD